MLSFLFAGTVIDPKSDSQAGPSDTLQFGAYSKVQKTIFFVFLCLLLGKNNCN